MRQKGWPWQVLFSGMKGTEEGSGQTHKQKMKNLNIQVFVTHSPGKTLRTPSSGLLSLSQMYSFHTQACLILVTNQSHLDILSTASPLACHPLLCSFWILSLGQPEHPSQNSPSDPAPLMFKGSQWLPGPTGTKAKPLACDEVIGSGLSLWHLSPPFQVCTPAPSSLCHLYLLSCALFSLCSRFKPDVSA